MDYYRGFACTSQLWWAGATLLRGHGSGAFTSGEGVAHLPRHIDAVTGIHFNIGRSAGDFIARKSEAVERRSCPRASFSVRL